MGIIYNSEERIFKIDTPKSTYMLGIGDDFGHIVHVYYGKKIEGDTFGIPLPTIDPKNKIWYMDGSKMEYPTGDIGDFREHCIEIKNANGAHALECGYKKHRIYGGKPEIPGLPATFAGENECTTLELTLVDEIAGVELVLIYSAFEDVDVITRSVRVKNIGSDELKLTKILSACIDVDNNNFEIITLHGSWGRERHIQRNKLTYGRYGVYSERGVSSHQDHPFMAIVVQLRKWVKFMP